MLPQTPSWAAGKSSQPRRNSAERKRCRAPIRRDVTLTHVVKTPARLALVALSVCACDDGGPSPSDASIDVVKESAVIDVTLPDVMPLGRLDPECAVPAQAGSGACVTVGDGGYACNPVTGAGCNADAGETCDYEGTGFHCYPPPPPATAAVCATCDLAIGPACAPTNTCVPIDGGFACARFCCVDGDCGQGHCEVPAGQVVGVCLRIP